MNRTMDRISGLDKASILLMSLGSEGTARVFEYLTEDEREILSSQIVRLKRVDTITRRQVIDEVTKHVREAEKNREYEQSANKANDKPLVWMENIDHTLIAQTLNKERAQSVALILSLLSPQFAAKILAELEDKLRNQVVVRMATMKPITDKALSAVDEAMRAKLLTLPKAQNARYTKQSLNKIIGDAAGQVRASITRKPEQQPSAEIIKSVSKYTNPEQILSLSDAETFEVLTRMRIDDLITVLRVGSEELRAKILRNVSPDSAQIIKKSLANPSQPTLKVLEDATNRILEVMDRWMQSYSMPLKAA